MDVDVGYTDEGNRDENEDNVGKAEEKAEGHAGGDPSEADSLGMRTICTMTQTSISAKKHTKKIKTKLAGVMAMAMPEDSSAATTSLTTSLTNLPAELFKQDKWKCKVLPMLCLWAGVQLNMWDMPKEKIAGVLGCIIPIILPELSKMARKLTAQHKMVSVAYQYLCNWHHSIGSAALSLCASIFDDLLQEKIIEQTGVLLTHHGYLYKDIDCDDPSKAFKSEFIVQLLVHGYLPSIKGFMHVDKLNTSALSHYSIQGILGLCSTAIQRALHLISKDDLPQDTKGKGTICMPATLNKASSKVSTTMAAISEQNWGVATKGLSAAAKCHTPNELNNILEIACEAVGETAASIDGASEEASDKYAKIRL